MLSIIFAAAFLAVAHSLANPNHYLPFVALGRARGWSLLKTVAVAVFSGTGHLVAFVAAAAVGLVLGKGLEVFKEFAHWGADFGKWLFVAFGAAYTLFGVAYALKKRKAPQCNDGSCEAFCGRCGKEKAAKKGNWSYAWLMFFLFALGPCDAIIPIVIYSAAEGGWQVLAILTAVYYFFTIASMALATALLYKGIALIGFKGVFFSRWAHAISGIVIVLAALAAVITGHSHAH